MPKPKPLLLQLVPAMVTVYVFNPSRFSILQPWVVPLESLNHKAPWENKLCSSLSAAASDFSHWVSREETKLGWGKSLQCLGIH